jgi:HSP20 family molecular chaperone IbpA
LLTVAGTRQQEEKREEANWRISERRFGSFERTLRVPRGLKEDEIKAEMSNGILRLEFPSSPKEAETKKITIG